MSKKQFEDLDDLRDYTETEIRVYKYEFFFIVKIGSLLTYISDNRWDTRLEMLGIVDNFKALEKQNLESREIEIENTCNRELMPLNVFKGIVDYFNVDLTAQLNELLEMEMVED